MLTSIQREYSAVETHARALRVIPRRLGYIKVSLGLHIGVKKSPKDCYLLKTLFEVGSKKSSESRSWSIGRHLSLFKILP